MKSFHEEIQAGASITATVSGLSISGEESCTVYPDEERISGTPVWSGGSEPAV